MSENTEASLKLDAALDIAHANALKADLNKLLGQDGDLVLDGSDVVRTDAAGLQLLVAFARHCESKGRNWRWSDNSELLREDIAGLGLASILETNSTDQGGQ